MSGIISTTWGPHYSENLTVFATFRKKTETKIPDTFSASFSASVEWSMNADESSSLDVWLADTIAHQNIFWPQALTGIGTWSSSGYLDPGQYAFGANGHTSAYPMSGWEWPSMTFSATFSLTSEPATLALAALGTFGLVRRRRPPWWAVGRD